MDQSFIVSPAALTVSADPTNKIYGDTDPALTWQLTSGSLVSGDSFAGGLTRATGENVGTYAILQNTLTAGANYNLTYNGANLTISQKSLTVTADNKSKTQGLANPLLTASYNGFVNGENTNTLTTQVTLSTTADASSPAGTPYPITATGAAATNYTISYVGGNVDSCGAAKFERHQRKRKSIYHHLADCCRPELPGGIQGQFR